MRRFEITGPGAAAYRDSINVEWVADNSPMRNFSTSREQAPQLVDWAPGEQSRQARQLTITAGDANGHRDVEFIQLIVNSTQDGHNACYLSYEPRNQRLLLYDDSSNGIAGASAIGAPEVLENSKCAVNLAESWVRASGEQITLSIAAALRSSVKAPQKIFAAVIDHEKQSAAWRQVSEWPATGNVSDAPWQFPETAPGLQAGRGLAAWARCVPPAPAGARPERREEHRPRPGDHQRQRLRAGRLLLRPHVHAAAGIAVPARRRQRRQRAYARRN